MLLAIDPGACSGWALFGDGRLVACGLNEPTKSDVDEVVIEHPVIYPGGRTANPNSIVKLAINAGEWAGRFKATGATIRYVIPRTWKGTVKAEICNARTLAKLSPEERTVVDDAIVSGKMAKGKQHNMLDAIGIGLFATGRK